MQSSDQPALVLLLVLRAKEGGGEAFGLCSVYEPRLLYVGFILGTNIFPEGIRPISGTW